MGSGYEYLHHDFRTHLCAQTGCKWDYGGDDGCTDIVDNVLSFIALCNLYSNQQTCESRGCSCTYPNQLFVVLALRVY